LTSPTTITVQPGTSFIDITREFDATPAQVFHALTDDLDSDLRPGGTYRYIHRDHDGAKPGFRGVFHSIVKDELIIRTFELDSAPGQAGIETTTLTALGNRTRLHIRSVYPSVESRDAAVAGGIADGVDESMDRLEELAIADRASPAAGRVVVDISMSLDGYVTAPGADLEHGLGVGGGALHAWAMSDSETLDAAVARTGAVIMGRRTFDFIDGPNGWGQEVADGMSREPGMPPSIFVVTRSKPESTRLKGFTFVAGLDEAVDKARVAAGDKDVVIMGGGAVSHAFLEAGLVDALILHVAPIILGDGTPLFPAGPSASFRLEREETQCTPAAVHVTYRVLPN
jgi:dihydrofolate reductase/uncharacterized protein YndB with AHSA1/START domain